MRPLVMAALTSAGHAARVKISVPKLKMCGKSIRLSNGCVTSLRLCGAAKGGFAPDARRSWDRVPRFAVKCAIGQNHKSSAWELEECPLWSPPVTVADRTNSPKAEGLVLELYPGLRSRNLRRFSITNILERINHLQGRYFRFIQYIVKLNQFRRPTEYVATYWIWNLF